MSRVSTDHAEPAVSPHQWGRRFLRVTLWTIGVLLLLHLAGQFLVRFLFPDSVFWDELSWRFNVDLELNVPTWYASFLAAVASLSALFVASQYRRQGVDRFQYIVWALLAGALLVVSIGETASFHELILQTLHVQAELDATPSYQSNAWLLVIPLLALGAAGGLGLVYRAMPRRSFVRIAVAACIYLAGAIGVEYVSIPISDESLLYNFFLTPLEEGLEMVGMWLVIRAMFLHVREELPDVDKRLQNVWQ